MRIMNFFRSVLRLEEAHKPTLDSSTNPILIAIIGCTGTGISTFINAITDSHEGEVSLEHIPVKPHTSRIRPVPIQVEGIPPDQFPVYLVDTRGIDFISGPDLKTTFKNLSEWKGCTFDRKVTFAGIIFMHRQVNQPLPKGELSIQHDAILKILCGADWRNRMILAHNYREEAGPGISSESLQKHEDELRVGFWKHVTMGDNIQRFDFHDQRKSAWKILWPLMKGASNDLENKLVTAIRNQIDQGVPRTDRSQDIYEALQEASSKTPERRICTTT